MKNNLLCTNKQSRYMKSIRFLTFVQHVQLGKKQYTRQTHLLVTNSYLKHTVEMNEFSAQTERKIKCCSLSYTYTKSLCLTVFRSLGTTFHTFPSRCRKQVLQETRGNLATGWNRQAVSSQQMRLCTTRVSLLTAYRVTKLLNLHSFLWKLKICSTADSTEKGVPQKLVFCLPLQQNDEC